MPNWTYNTLTAKGLGKMDIFSEKKGKKVFDFEKIIPMPECLKDTISPVPQNCAFLYFLKNGMSIEEAMRKCDEYHLPPNLKTIDEREKRTKNSLIAALDEKSVCGTDKSLYEMGEIVVRAYEETGHTNWYNWSCENWGTKWNADTVSIEEDEIVFNTAWDAPTPVIMQLARMYPETDFVMRSTYEDDDGYDYLIDVKCREGVLEVEDWVELVRSIDDEYDEDEEIEE